MGDQEKFIHARRRAVGGVLLLLGAAIALSSCSAADPTPGSSGTATAESTSAAVPSATAASSPEPTAASTPATGSTPTRAADGRSAVTPFITTADWDGAEHALAVGAIVTGVVQDDGTCTVTARSGATSRTAVADGVAAGSYTGCQAVALAGLRAGRWDVTVRYESAASVGTSAVTAVDVP